MPHRPSTVALLCVLIAGVVLLLTADPALAAEAAKDAPGKGEQESSLLSFDVGSYIWKLIIFGVFFLLLAKFVWPPILKGLQDREQKQRRDLQDAERAAKEADKTLAEYKQQLAEAQKEAQRIVDESRTAAQQVAAQVKADADRDAQQRIERVQKEIAAAKESALADIYEQSAELSTQIASRILKRELNPQDQQGLVTESLQQIQANRN